MKLVCACRFCGRVRIGGEWVEAEMASDTVGMCRPCMERRIRTAERKRRDECRRLRQNKFVKLPDLKDAFAAIKYDAEREGK